eukprot:scaffold116005_cov63-Attheya_sp.AAC.2
MRNNSVVGQKRSREDELSSDDSYVYTESNMSATAPEKISSQKFGKLWMEDPMLFYTIVYGSERRVVEEEDTCTSGDDTGGEELSMMIGCFFAEKRPVRDRGNNHDVRLALMYRKHEKGEADIAAALGSMLKQIYWFKDYRQNEHGKNWQYLGPHCALVTTSATETDEVETKEVYRSYDSRPWPISRSSAVYRNKALHQGTCAVVNSVRDEGWSPTRTQTPYRIFDFRGELDIIAIPFIEGRHIPEMIDQLIEVAHHLKRFHDCGFVHGDPRLLNMVFGPKSQLIDFDFGGREEENLKYPSGYRYLVPDGQRQGKAGMPITKSDDVYALVQAFNKILRRAGDQWEDLCDQTDATVDDAIIALETLRDEARFEIRMTDNLRTFLECHTKLQR